MQRWEDDGRALVRVQKTTATFYFGSRVLGFMVAVTDRMADPWPREARCGSGLPRRATKAQKMKEKKQRGHMTEVTGAGRKSEDRGGSVRDARGAAHTDTQCV